MADRPSRPGSRPGLDHQVRHLISLSVLAALGRTDDLARYLVTALQAGIRDESIREVLLQVSLFAGFPRGITALEALRRSAEEAGKRPPPDGAIERCGDPAVLRERGKALFRTVYGEKAEEVLVRISELHPLLPDWILTSAYGQVLARPQVPLRTREYVAVACLAALEQYAQLLAHMRGAVNAGGSADELREVFSQLSLHLEEPQIEKAYRLLEKM